LAGGLWGAADARGRWDEANLAMHSTLHSMEVGISKLPV